MERAQQQKEELGLGLWHLFQLYRGGQFYWWRNRRNLSIYRKSLTKFIT